MVALGCGRLAVLAFCSSRSTDDLEVPVSVLVLEWAVSGIDRSGELLPAQCSSSRPCAQDPNKDKNQ